MSAPLEIYANTNWNMAGYVWSVRVTIEELGEHYVARLRVESIDGDEDDEDHEWESLEMSDGGDLFNWLTVGWNERTGNELSEEDELQILDFLRGVKHPLAAGFERARREWYGEDE